MEKAGDTEWDGKSEVGVMLGLNVQLSTELEKRQEANVGGRA